MTVQPFAGSAPQFGVIKTTWAALTKDDTGAPQSLPHAADTVVQVKGTFGPGGSVQMEGSNDGGTTYSILTDDLGQPVVFTAAGQMAVIREQPDLVRPNSAAGDNTNAIIVSMNSRVKGV